MMAVTLDFLSADKVLETDWPEPVWAVPGLLPVGLTLLAGKPKAGKSWLALQIAQAVASGGMALGCRVQPGRVCYLALEDRPQRLQHRMRLLNWPPGLAVDFMLPGEFQAKIGSLALKGQRATPGGELLAREIERRGYRLVVVDTLSRSGLGDQLDHEVMVDALAPLQDLAQRINCAIVFVDHHRKNMGNPDAILDVLGSVAKGMIADCIWGLYRQSGKWEARLAIAGKDVEEQELVLQVDPETGCWQNGGKSDAIKLTAQRKQLLDALQDLGAATLTEIARAAGADKGNTSRRLGDLEAAGLVRRVSLSGTTLYQLAGVSDAVTDGAAP